MLAAMFDSLLLALAFQGTPSIAVEEVRLVGYNQSGYGGSSVAVSGDTALFRGTGPGGDRVHVFVRSGASWAQEAELAPSNSTLGDRFGASVAIEGDTAVVGATESPTGSFQDGAAFVFERTGTSWSETAMLTGDPLSVSFGSSVALSGDTILVGDRQSWEFATSAGAAYVFVRNGAGWVEQARLSTPDLAPYDHFGHAVSLEGDTAVVGAYSNDHSGSSDAGAAYVFARSETSWLPVQKLVAPDAAQNDRFGTSVFLWGDRMVIGADHDTPAPAPPLSPGSAYLFGRDGPKWSFDTKLIGSNPTAFAEFGQSVHACGDTVVVGAPLDDVPGANDGGSAFVFQLVGGAWQERMKLTATGANSATFMGDSVAIDGDAVLTTAPLLITSPTENGATLVFRLSDPVSYCTAGTSAIGCQASISASGLPSATLPSGFRIQAAGTQGMTVGLFFYGANGRQALPWGNGTSYQCVVPPVKRGALHSTEGAPGQCGGLFGEDLNARWCPSCPKPLHNPGPGATVQGQFWYRDPLSTSNQTTSLSDAIEFPVGP